MTSFSSSSTAFSYSHSSPSSFQRRENFSSHRQHCFISYASLVGTVCVVPGERRDLLEVAELVPEASSPWDPWNERVPPPAPRKAEEEEDSSASGNADICTSLEAVPSSSTDVFDVHSCSSGNQSRLTGRLRRSFRRLFRLKCQSRCADSFCLSVGVSRNRRPQFLHASLRLLYRIACTLVYFRLTKSVEISSCEGRR